VASLNAQLKTSKNDFDKLKFARDAYTVGRHPSIKDGVGVSDPGDPQPNRLVNFVSRAGV
jgi:hypothetical protein